VTLFFKQSFLGFPLGPAEQREIGFEKRGKTIALLSSQNPKQSQSAIQSLFAFRPPPEAPPLSPRPLSVAEGVILPSSVWVMEAAGRLAMSPAFPLLPLLACPQQCLKGKRERKKCGRKRKARRPSITFFRRRKRETKSCSDGGHQAEDEGGAEVRKGRRCRRDPMGPPYIIDEQLLLSLSFSSIASRRPHSSFSPLLPQRRESDEGGNVAYHQRPSLPSLSVTLFSSFVFSSCAWPLRQIFCERQAVDGRGKTMIGGNSVRRGRRGNSARVASGSGEKEYVVLAVAAGNTKEETTILVIEFSSVAERGRERGGRKGGFDGGGGWGGCVVVIVNGLTRRNLREGREGDGQKTAGKPSPKTPHVLFPRLFLAAAAGRRRTRGFFCQG
jgi:hypothetical protein